MTKKPRRFLSLLAGFTSPSLVIPVFLSVHQPDPAVRAEATKPFVLGEIAGIKSKILGEDRELYIYTHPAYNEDQSCYPVAYVLDGEWNIRHSRSRPKTPMSGKLYRS